MSRDLTTEIKFAGYLHEVIHKKGRAFAVLKTYSPEQATITIPIPEKDARRYRRQLAQVKNKPEEDKRELYVDTRMTLTTLVGEDIPF